MTPVVRVLEEDPGLGRGLAPERQKAARHACLAELIRLPRGSWSAGGEKDLVKHGFGLLVLSGLLNRRVGRVGRYGVELLGPGDLLRPWDHPAIESMLPFSAEWNVVKPARVAILDARFAARAAPYPEIAAELIRRVLARSRQLALAMAIVHHPRVETRVEMMLWVLGERWARVRREGIVLSLPLTHAVIADLVAASRPAVSAALSALSDRGRVTREGDLWLLTGPPPGELDAVDRSPSGR